MVEVVMFGVGDTTVCRGCEAGRTLGELAAALKAKLERSFGDKVRFEFVDLTDDAARERYPKEVAWLEKSQPDLPVTLVDGRSVYPGLFSPTMITYAIKVRLRELGEG